jgi:glycosyltransferase involved in cell wall biosynthesis
MVNCRPLKASLLESRKIPPSSSQTGYTRKTIISRNKRSKIGRILVFSGDIMTDSDLVSVLIPAFKPEFFKTALLSVLNQTHQNIEILIGDDSGHLGIREIIEEINDPRVIYIPSYQVTHQNPRLNHMILWYRARGKYVRFVYDDDIIYPRSTEVLLDQIKKIPGCVMSWHQRELIDKEGKVFLKLDFLGQLQEVYMDRALLLDNLIKHQNFIGEPSFVLLDKTMFNNFIFKTYAGVEVVFHWDVAMFLEASRYGLLAGNYQCLGSFRKHAVQMSSTLKGMFVPLEWELILRNEYKDKSLSQENFNFMLATTLYNYKLLQNEFPILMEFHKNLIDDFEKNRIVETLPRFINSFNKLALGSIRKT